MAKSGSSDWATAIAAAATSRNIHPSWNDYNFVRKVHCCAVTVKGGDANGDYYDLGPLGVEGARIVPEQCVIRYGGSGTTNFTARLDKIAAADGTNTNLTTAVTCDASGVEVFAAAANTARPVLKAADSLRLTLPAVTTATAGRILLLEIAYDFPNR